MLSKIISLLIGASYVVALILIFRAGPVREGAARKEYFEAIYYCSSGLVIWLALSLGCIWWGEELGEGLIGAKYGLVSAPSPGWAVKLIGWLLLLLPAVIACYVQMQGGNHAGG